MTGLRWRVDVAGEMVARFKHERDARGFAKARYGEAATVIGRRTRQAIVQAALEAGAQTVSEISAVTGLTRAHVWGVLGGMQRRGIVAIVGTRPAGSRPATLYQLTGAAS